jgi:hypothetical protein
MLKMLNKIVENRWYSRLMREIDTFYQHNFFEQPKIITPETIAKILDDIEYTMGIEMANGNNVQKLQELHNKIQML